MPSLAELAGFDRNPISALGSLVDSLKQQLMQRGSDVASNPGILVDELKQRLAEFAQGQQQNRGSMQSVMPEVRERAMQDSLAQAMNLGGLAAITAYHGSPHTFDKFDMSKIGTGEGAQAYGHGLYFAENPDVAKGYADTLGNAVVKVDGRNVGSARSGAPADAARLVAQQGGIDAALAKVDALASAKNPIYPYNTGRYNDVLRNEIRALSGRQVAQESTGRTYKVDIPDEAVAKMLDWDKPLSQQPEAVQKALTVAFRDRGFPLAGGTDIPAVLLNDKLTGEQLHAYLASALQGKGNNAAGQAAAADRLKQLGVTGIRYLDAGSRGSGGTSNFVLFDDQLPKILGRE